MTFDSPDEELQFLRALVRLTEMADVVLEDCLERGLGLASAVDVYLAQAARMVHARAGFVQVKGRGGPVLTRVLGNPGLEVDLAAGWDGAVALEGKGTLFVAPLSLGSTRIGALGLLLDGEHPPRTPVLKLVRTLAEQLDTAVLSFMALSDGHSPLDRLDELSDRAAFRPRAKLGRYELVTPLGTGGMAQVMVARTVGPEGLGRLVALKRILPHLSAEPGMVEQFLDEARIGLRLSHPNVVTFYEFGQHGGAYFIAMELVKGVDFSLFIQSWEAGVPPDVAVAVMAQALSGLHAAHEVRDEQGALMGLVHRDLSPHNLMVGFDGVVKVLDFGVAKARMQRTVTLPGIVKGKPLYMSPEQAVGETVDRRSDLFAMGIILYEALTGTVPWLREDDAATMQAIVSDRLPDHPRIPRPLWAVLEKALAKDPDARPRTALALRDLLLEAQAPVDEVALGRLVRGGFPDRMRDFVDWDRTGRHARAESAPEEVEKASTRRVKAVGKG